MRCGVGEGASDFERSIFDDSGELVGEVAFTGCAKEEWSGDVEALDLGWELLDTARAKDDSVRLDVIYEVFHLEFEKSLH